jgi:AcrR family transcriptional regulator
MTTPGLRERKKARTRWAIQEHALRLFAEQGYEQTTVDQIAAAADISPSTFFRYFKTKEDVVFADEYDPLIVALITSAPAGLSPLEAIRHAVVSQLGDVTDEDQATILARARMYENFNGQTEVFTAPIAIRMGREPDDPMVHAFCGGVIGALLPAIYGWAEHDGEEKLSVAITRALDALAEGVRGA